MSEADEMFEKLGYRKAIEDYKGYNNSEILSSYEINSINMLRRINFWNDKSITISGNETYIELTFQELQAIYKKSEELRWI